MDFKNYVSFMNSELNVLKGVGEKKSALFAKLGINCVWDLLYYFPSSYEDRTSFSKVSELCNDDFCCIKVRPVGKLQKKLIKKGICLYMIRVADESGMINAKWFSAPYLKEEFNTDDEYIFYGKTVNSFGRKEFELKSYDKSQNNKNTGIILPVYKSVSGLSQNSIRSAISVALENVDIVIDSIPERLLKKNKLPSVDKALRMMHNPTDMLSLEIARKRFVYEELFVLQLALLLLKTRRVVDKGFVFENVKCVADFALKLPFELTDSQKSVLNEICTDLKSGKPMNRLLQGDVGSGKTMVAAGAIYACCKNGFQSALMAPTEILAVQHYNTLKTVYGDEISIALVTSSTPNKKKILDEIADGKFNVVIGTHALIEGKVAFKNLALCITDEQHRFGVNQRAKLFEKGITPHVLVMSATPIPRTLSLILYGDLDVSIINTMPNGRQPIDTFCVKSDMHDRVYTFVKKQIDMGRQGYVVCPLVEQSESMDVLSGVEYEQFLRQNVFKGYKTGLLHGKMNSEQKEKVMNTFKNKEIDLLVSTTVIEVGVDVPNANIMIIENSERFGLSQLHQLRGRVGRGEHKSYCILVTDSESKQTKQRMETMTSTNDGFVVSQKDLELRGCGEFFGTRQHGLPELKVANLFTDMEVLKIAQSDCTVELENDPNLEGDDIRFIRNRIQKLFGKFDNFNIFN